MMGIILALLAALAYALSMVLARKELHESNFFSVSLVVAVMGTIILWPLVLLFTCMHAGTVNLKGVLFFAIAGILGDGIGRLLYFKGMEAVGVSLNASVFATYPLYTSVFAVLLLSETLAPENWIGILCIVVGVVSIERSLGKPKTGPKRIFEKGLVLPLLASVIVAVAYIARKHGLNICKEPLLGTAIGFSLSFLLYLLLSISSHTMRGFLSLGKDFRLFWKVGACISLTRFLSFQALSLEKVSIVASLLQTGPLFVLFFAYLYLKELEHISFGLVINTLVIVIGTMLVSF